MGLMVNVNVNVKEPRSRTHTHSLFQVVTLQQYRFRFRLDRRALRGGEGEGEGKGPDPAPVIGAPSILSCRLRTFSIFEALLEIVILLAGYLNLNANVHKVHGVCRLPPRIIHRSDQSCPHLSGSPTEQTQPDKRHQGLAVPAANRAPTHARRLAHYRV